MAAQDDYVGTPHPAGGAEEVTPHDTNELAYVSRGLYVGGTGDVTVKMHRNMTVTFTAVPAGMILPIQVRQVLDTGTDATGIVALY